ncbi:MAG TPA: hypothetical protein VL172_02700, partial [Kofleriaceae bacterium]|nr:hypothetical protein [Kofleriaceae bacterium]
GDDRARPPVRVRELRLRWGGEADPMAAAGRLRWAGVALGPLDGVRVSAPVGRGLRVAGFGGLVPDPIDGRPDTRAARFGAEVVLDRPAAPWQPRLSLSALGSTWEGALDERRALATADVARGRLRAAAFAEVSGFTRDNPWGARRVELTAAGFDAGARGPGWRVNAGLGLRQPERSLMLAALLPPEWLCTTTPVAGAAAEPCAGQHENRLTATLGGGLQRGRLSVDAGASVIGDLGTGADLSGFAGARWLAGARRLELGVEAGHLAFLDWGALRLGAGAQLGDDLDATAYYRPALLQYRAALSTWVEHRAGGELTWARPGGLDLTATLEAVTGGDVDAVLLLWTATWRRAW